MADNFSPKAFWEFRDFSTYGGFSFNREGLKQNEVDELIKKLGVDVNRSKVDIFFLSYNSDKIQTLDGIANEGKIKDIVNWNSLNPKEILHENEKSIIYLGRDGLKRIIFLTNLDEMKSVNGFLKYNSEDRKITEGKYWISLSLVR